MATRSCQLLVVCLLAALHVSAQTIRGVVIALDSGQPLGQVTIVNIHTSVTSTNDSNGQFTAAAVKGQLVEFRHDGYKTESIRLPAGTLPPYFKVHLEKLQPAPLYARQPYGYDWHADSLRYAEMYKKELAFPTFTTLDYIQHPFSALSRHNQQIWAFQKEYSWYEKQKFVDYVFNERIISTITGLQGDSAQTYMRTFRPAYEQVRSMNEYDYFLFLQRTVNWYRQGFNPRHPPGRSAD